jgi:TolB-like protein
LTRAVTAAVAILVLLGVSGWAGWRWLGTPESAGLPLPDRPSVAVLPFTNLSQDPAQDYFSDGVTEDLITGLSKVSGLFVIARNSVFTYKGKAVKVREVGRDLGVRYVLEGGVQRSGSRVRITAQLVDATTGYHIWALAPNDADGYETLAEILGWSGRPEESIRMIRQAMRLNPHYPFYYLWTLGHGYYLTGRRQEALDAFAKLVEENPNFFPAYAYRAVLFGELGRVNEAREAWETANHLNPDVSIQSLRERVPYKRPADLDRLLTAAHRAGMQ